MKNPFRPVSRSGFTLLEVLIAATLTLLLLMAVYSSVDIYLKTRTAGREQVARDKLARAIMQQLQSDVRSVLFMVPDAEEVADSENADSADSSTDSADSSADEVAAEDVEIVPELTFYGEPQLLVMRISRPLKSLAYVEDAVQLGGRSSDVVEVQYFLAEPGAEGVAGMLTADQLNVAPGASLVGVTETGIQGLARIEADPAVMAVSDSSSLATMARIIAPEVNYLQFRYFDGAEVVDSWDSSVMGRLPSAVEVEIGFRPQQDFSTREVLAGQGSQPEQVYRQLIALPLAQPYVVEEEL